MEKRLGKNLREVTLLNCFAHWISTMGNCPNNGKLPLEKWLGKNLRKVSLFNCGGGILATIIAQLADFEFSHLEVSLYSLTKDDLCVSACESQIK